MRNIFITKNNFKQYMQEAINVYIASSYLNRIIIEDIKANLQTLPFKGGRNFKFLLNQDFHEDEQMRKVLVNMLLELPNTEVRIYKGAKVFHAKVYLFETGNNMFAAIGSFNATAGGAGGNIEAGVRISDREIAIQAKDFFDGYWESEFTEVAQYDESAIFVARKFKAGDAVIIKSNNKKGVVLNTQPALIENEWEYDVFVEDHPARYRESNLSHLDVAWYGNELEFTISDNSTSIEKWQIDHILEKAFSLSYRVLTSYASSRTEVYAYQFRPLLKILYSLDHRLLIADDVGLGKTIEAGIILKEFQSRNDMKRILIIVPNSLKTKWRDELRVRFDEYYDVISGSDVVTFFDDYVHAAEGAIIKGIVTYDQMSTGTIRGRLEKMSGVPVFDMIIIDEAHHLKNSSTIRHQVVKKLTRNARALILLTATPIQLETTDLLNLLTILLPKYGDDSLAFRRKLTLNEKIMQSIKYLTDGKLVDFKIVINEIGSKVAFRKQLELYEHSSAILEECLSVKESTSSSEVKELIKNLYELNILSRYISRTLRKDVAIKFPDRIVKTQLYEYIHSEKVFYDAILDYCRKYYSKKKNPLAFIVFERQAASSLIAMIRTSKGTSFTEQIMEYQASLDTLYSDDVPGVDEIDEGAYNSVTSKINKISVPRSDSKLEKLREIIEGIFTECSNDIDKKVLIFCAFIPTINYLKEELSRVYPTIYIETMTGGDNIEERDIKKKCFKAKSPALLICSEVAGEGLDFQFCHYLINYDMPWNPSRLEQRVGRIDRIGQMAEKITIINLVNKYTIEDYIMAKLFERIKLFNNTIGPLGEILGNYQKEFSSSILKPERSEREKEEYQKKILENLENKRKEQEAFEQNKVELFGVLDYFYDPSNARTSYFTEVEVKFIWDYYLQELSSNNDERLIISVKDDIFEIKVDENARKMLLANLERGLLGILNKKKRDHYRLMINSASEKNSVICYTFSHRGALDNLNIEFFNITHPFIQGALQYLKSGYVADDIIISCMGDQSGFSVGTYIFIIYKFEILDADSHDNRFVEERIFVYDIKNDKGRWEYSDIIYEIFKSGRQCPTDPKTLDLLKEVREYLETQSKNMGNQILEEYKTMIFNADIDKRKETLVQHYNTKIESIRKNLQVMHDQYQRGKLEEEIKSIEEDKKRKLLDIKVAQLKLIIRCSGIIVFQQEVPA